ncbi:isocitrate lyase/phosphoenolpyruvate mutase family protein, partial [Vibrio splendidus]
MFKNMHKMEEPLVISNVWDVPSAKIAESVGFSA